MVAPSLRPSQSGSDLARITWHYLGAQQISYLHKFEELGVERQDPASKKPSFTNILFTYQIKKTVDPNMPAP